MASRFRRAMTSCSPMVTADANDIWRRNFFICLYVSKWMKAQLIARLLPLKTSFNGSPYMEIAKSGDHIIIFPIRRRSDNTRYLTSSFLNLIDEWSYRRGCAIYCSSIPLGVEHLSSIDTFQLFPFSDHVDIIRAYAAIINDAANTWRFPSCDLVLHEDCV